MSRNGKGSAQRKRQVTKKTWDENHERTFPNSPKPFWLRADNQPHDSAGLPPAALHSQESR